MPFLNLYKPFNYPISVGLGIFRTFTDVNQFRTIDRKNYKDITFQTLKTTITITSVGLTILAPPLGMLITSTQDLVIEIRNLRKYLKSNESQKALECCFNIINSSLYLALFAVGGTKLTIASLAIQILVSIYYADLELDKGNYFEAVAHSLMVIIRCKQMIDQAGILQKKWKAQELRDRQMNEELQRQKDEIEKIRQELEALYKQKVQESEIHKIKIDELHKQLLDCLEIERILLLYGNNSDGLSALNYAINQGNRQATDLLTEYKSNIASRSERIELIIQNTLNAAFDYYTAGLEEKVRLLFLQAYAQDQSNAQFVREPYRTVLMHEAMDGIKEEINILSKILHCENQVWFWNTVQGLLNKKTFTGSQKLNAFIEIRKATLMAPVFFSN